MILCFITYQIVHNVLEEFQNRKKPKENLNKKEAAEYLRISVSSIDRKIKEGRIKFSKLGGRVVFKKSDLDNYRDASQSSSAIQEEIKK